MPKDRRQSSFLYVADCKLATRDNMDHIASHEGRFLTVLPRTRKEDEAGRDYLSSGPVPWEEISRRPGRRKHDPPEVYWAVPAPACSTEGYRIIWIKSSTKRTIDGAVRTSRIEDAVVGLGELSAKLGAKRCQLKSRAAVEDAAYKVVEEAGAGRWVGFGVAEHTTTEHRQQRRGRPGPNTTYRRIDHRSFSLSFEVDTAAVGRDAVSDGCFPLVTNDEVMSPAELLVAYKGQPHLERRHHNLKGVIDAAPIELKSDTRIDAFGFCLYAALLVHALVELTIRRAMATARIAELPLYPEGRACKAPTAELVFKLLDPLASHRRPPPARGAHGEGADSQPATGARPGSARHPAQRIRRRLVDAGERHT